MISFYPGPSQVAAQTTEWMTEAVESGILGQNHRSDPFMELFRETRKVIREKLNVPETYEIIFLSSATECWQVLTESYTHMKHYHLHNGAFGEKWFNYALKLYPLHYSQPFDKESLPAPRPISEDSLWINFTHCETSLGTFTPIHPKWKALNPEAFIAVDATSSLGGTELDISVADIWYASVQKCLGLPSGMAVMILSPKAVQKAHEINERGHYNSLAFTLDNAKKDQTTYTPNTLGIYLLNRTLRSRPELKTVADNLRERMAQLETFVENHPQLQFYIQNKEVRGHTVAVIESNPEFVKIIKEQALQNDILLGNGYGNLKETTFRIANFPSVTAEQWDTLMDFLSKSMN